MRKRNRYYATLLVEHVKDSGQYILDDSNYSPVEADY